MKLNFKLTDPNPKVYYHLCHLSGILKVDTHRYGIEAIFYETDKRGKRVYSKYPKIFMLNILESPFLYIDSLWDSNGKLFKLNVKSRERMEFNIAKDDVLKSISIIDTLPNFKFLADFLEFTDTKKIRRSHIFEFIVNDIHIIIPIGEFFRTFYYLNTSIIKILYEGDAFDKIGYILANTNNDGIIKMSLGHNGFKKREQFLLAELLLTQELGRNLKHTHSMLRKYFHPPTELKNGSREGLVGMLFHTFHSPNDINIQVRGFNYLYKYKQGEETIEKKCFYVTRIVGVENFFSFKTLEVEVTPDTRSLRDSNENLEPARVSSRILFEDANEEEPIIDSNLDGSSNYNNLEYEDENSEYFQLPNYIRNDKLSQEFKYDKALAEFCRRNADYISNHGGGTDSSIAKGELKNVQEDILIKDQFENIFEIFKKKLKPQKISTLSAKNSHDINKTGDYIFYKTPDNLVHKFGAFEIVYNKAYFYYIQNFQNGRAGFICSKVCLNDSFFEILDTLYKVKEKDWNWASLAATPNLITLTRQLGFPVRIYARNNKGGERTVEICLSNITNFLNI